MTRNRYGVDVTYFEKWIVRSLKDLENYRPDELARELARMSRTADDSVLLEEEFSGAKFKELESELTRVNTLTETQAGIIRRLVDENVENTELKKANARIEELESELQGARRVISQIPDTL